MKKVLGLMTAAVIAAVSIVPIGANAAVYSPVHVQEQTVSDADLQAYANEVALIVNQERTSRGLAPLRVLPKLQQCAQVRADEITQVFDHTRPDGRRCFTVLGDYGLRYYYVGENIAAGQPTPESVMQAWMNSDGHRSNILGEQFMYIGVGVTQKNGVLYWSQIFLQHDEYAEAYYPVEQPAQQDGDLNADGMVDSRDASLILAEYSKVSAGAAPSLTPAQKKAADVDDSSMVDSKDASYVLGYYSYLSAGGAATGIKQWIG